MQSSPRTVAAFIVPALLPGTAWFFYQGENIQLAIGTLSVVFTILMLISARAMRTSLAKSFSIGSHNTELIRKLVSARETAEHAKGYSEKVNLKLQEQLPTHVVLYNAGIKLAMKQSPVCKSLSELEELGTRIMLCGSCIDHYGLQYDIGVGMISNMVTITETLANAGHVINP